MTTTNNPPIWTTIEKAGFRITAIFAVLFIISYTEPMGYFPSLRSWTDPFFEQLVLWSGKLVFGIKTAYTYQLTSDSTGAYIHVFNVGMIALVLGVFWGKVPTTLDYNKAWYWFSVIISYYLAYQLLLYGFNKVFKCQFFLPEPNTLYTTIGEAPKDLLFWSVMGSSYGYTVFGGLLEVLAACLLLYHKTRLLGALVSIGVLGNVVAINFGFNISVKVLSIFLLCLALILILPYRRSLYHFFIHKTFVERLFWQPTLKQKKRIFMVKVIVLWCLFFEVLAPYFVRNNFNDDHQERPEFHGAYEVLSFTKNNIPCPPLLGYAFRWKRVFVHRRGYFIVQTMDDKMQDYLFVDDNEEQVFVLEHTSTKETYFLKYKQATQNTLLLEGQVGLDNIQVRLSALNIEELPLLKNDFSWTIDGLK